MFRFIHSSDLHLGKRFGNFSGDLPGRLREARHASIGTLARLAHTNGADAILLAGDTFDTETPTAEVRRQALTEMAQHTAVRWVLLPGNHDSLQAVELWNAISSELPSNVLLATVAQPIELASGVFILPAPCNFRRPGRDLTEWMDAAPTPEGTLRIGIAHGAVQHFSEDRGPSDVIAPNRAEKAGLSYLALGDWHGSMQIGPRTWYSGSPEQDRFKHNRTGEALLVSLMGPNSQPQVELLTTGKFSWQSLDLHLLNSDDPAVVLKALLPPMHERRQTLVQINATGRSPLPLRESLQREVTNLTPDFAWFRLHDTELETEYAVDDLDAIDASGALRDAAEALLAEAQDERRSSAERNIAGRALARLYSYAQGVPK